MASIKARLEVEKPPTKRTFHWEVLQERAVLRLEGGQPSDLDARFGINRVLRSTGKDASIKKLLFPGSKPGITTQGTAFTNITTAVAVFENAQRNQSMYYGMICNHYQEYGQVIPRKYRELADLRPATYTIPPPPVGDLLTIGELKSAEQKVIWRTSSTNANRVTRWMDTGVPAKEWAAPKDLPEKSSNRLDDQSKWQIWDKSLRALEQKYKDAGRVVSLFLDIAEQNYGNFDWILEYPDMSKAEGATRPFPYPAFVEGVAEVEISYLSSLTIPKQSEKYIYDLLLKRGGDQLLWHAPQEAFDKNVNKPLPMSKEASSKCYKLVTQKDKSYSSLTNMEKAVLAWRWLLISYNHVYPKMAVSLPANLAFNYERRMNRKSLATTQQKVGEARIEEMAEKLISKFAGLVNKEPVEVEPTIRLSQLDMFLDEMYSTIDFLLVPSGEWNPTSKRFEVLAVGGGSPSQASIDRVGSANDLLKQVTRLKSGSAIEVNDPPSREALRSFGDDFAEEMVKAYGPKPSSSVYSDDDFCRHCGDDTTGVSRDEQLCPSCLRVSEEEKSGKPVQDTPLDKGKRPVKGEGAQPFKDTFERDGKLWVLMTQDELDNLPDAEIKIVSGLMYRALVDIGPPSPPKPESSDTGEKEGKKSKRGKAHIKASDPPRPLDSSSAGPSSNGGAPLPNSKEDEKDKAKDKKTGSNRQRR